MMARSSCGLQSLDVGCPDHPFEQLVARPIFVRLVEEVAPIDQRLGMPGYRDRNRVSDRITQQRFPKLLPPIQSCISLSRCVRIFGRLLVVTNKSILSFPILY